MRVDGVEVKVDEASDENWKPAGGISLWVLHPAPGAVSPVGPGPFDRSLARSRVREQREMMGTVYIWMWV